MIKRILVAIDLSDTSQTPNIILKQASLLAKKWSAELFIIHVLETTIYSSVFGKTSLKDQDTIRKQADILLKEKVKKNLDDTLKTKIFILSGNNTVKILDFCDKKKIDFLIMGPHSQRIIHDFFLGSTAENIIRQSKCPVLIVKNTKPHDYKKIILATDFSSASKQALKTSVALFPSSALTILHAANQWYEEALFKKEIVNHKRLNTREAMTIEVSKKMAAFIKSCRQLPEKTRTSIRTGYPAKTVVKEAQKTKSDLVVISAQSHTALHYIVIGSVANRVAHEASTNVLIVPAGG